RRCTRTFPAAPTITAQPRPAARRVRKSRIGSRIPLPPYGRGISCARSCLPDLPFGHIFDRYGSVSQKGDVSGALLPQRRGAAPPPKPGRPVFHLYLAGG